MPVGSSHCQELKQLFKDVAWNPRASICSRTAFPGREAEDGLPSSKPVGRAVRDKNLPGSPGYLFYALETSHPGLWFHTHYLS